MHNHHFLRLVTLYQMQARDAANGAIHDLIAASQSEGERSAAFLKSAVLYQSLSAQRSMMARKLMEIE